MTGRELPRLLENGLRRGHVEIAQISSNSGRLDLGFRFRMRQDRFELGPEKQPAPRPLHEHRLDAEAVTNQMKLALLAIPQRNRKHPDKTADRALDAPR